MNQLPKKLLIFLLGLTISVIFVVIGYELAFLGKIYQGISVAGINLSGLNKDQAVARLKAEITKPNLRVVSKDLAYTQNLDDINFSYDYHQSVANAYQIGRRTRFFTATKQKLEGIQKGINLPLATLIDEGQLIKTAEKIAENVYMPPIKPTVSIQAGKISVDTGRDGVTLNKEALIAQLKESIIYARKDPITLPVNIILTHLTENEVDALTKEAEKLVGKTIQLGFEEEKITLPDTKLVSLVSPFGINEDELNLLIEELAEKFNKPPQNARFLYDRGKVIEFVPAEKGVEVKKENLKEKMKSALEKLMLGNEQEAFVEIPINIIQPQISTEEVNNLGIKELLGRGISYFRGSSPSRIHNISLAASRLNGLLIKPGDVFSFNEMLGDVSVYTGYQQAYIIKGGQTVLGDGGGVCQVSTTFFRAALDAGLPIIERHPHAYRVSYYEQNSKPGFDATVYSPSVDLKVKNDTPAYILIQTKTDIKNATLTFELYGTSDGRVATVSSPYIWDVTPAPPALYIDDPTLPAGQIKQIDFAAAGAKTSFDYKVTRGEEILQQKTFYSNYRPWQARYLRGTKPNQ